MRRIESSRDRTGKNVDHREERERERERER